MGFGNRKTLEEDGGELRDGSVYTRKALRRILGVGEPAIRGAVKQGLRERVLFGKRVYLGADVIRYLEGHHSA